MVDFGCKSNVTLRHLAPTSARSPPRGEVGKATKNDHDEITFGCPNTTTGNTNSKSKTSSHLKNNKEKPIIFDFHFETKRCDENSLFHRQCSDFRTMPWYFDESNDSSRCFRPTSSFSASSNEIDGKNALLSSKTVRNRPTSTTFDFCRLEWRLDRSRELGCTSVLVEWCYVL